MQVVLGFLKTDFLNFALLITGVVLATVLTYAQVLAGIMAKTHRAVNTFSSAPEFSGLK